ncbi:unnamed protein product [Moneuplotes crassus]|uniref:Uncharacterized protein n=1 Tax=Euplotes crassus TaxID=5936 RepID=A0AAD1X1U7_EUPCR|nr:unnamed protein product [Moneuplotes crassus]
MEKATECFKNIKSLNREKSANSLNANFTSQRKPTQTCNMGTDPERSLKCSECIKRNSKHGSFCSCDLLTKLSYNSMQDPKLFSMEISNLAESFERRQKIGIGQVTLSTSQIKELLKDCSRTINEMIRDFEEKHEKQKLKHLDALVEQSKEIQQLTKSIHELALGNNALKAQVEALKSSASLPEIDDVYSLKQKNDELEEEIQELMDKIKYTRQRENKILYLFYCAQEEGIPLQDIFDKKIRKIPTERFEGIINSEASKIEIDHNQIRNKKKEMDDSIDVSSHVPSVSYETSYEPIAQGKQKKIKKPDCIKTLNFDCLSAFRGSSTDQNSKTNNFSELLKADNFRSKKSISHFDEPRQFHGSHKKMPSIIMPQCEFDVNLSKATRQSQ